MKRIIGIFVVGFALAGCTTGQLEKIQSASANYQASVASINASIAATAPTIAVACADIQKYAMLLAPFVPTSGKAPQYFNAANAAINSYCQAIPTDITGTAVATASAAKAALNGYNNVKAGA